MRNNFYSFSDAFREANRKQKIEYFTSEQEQAQLTATRRQFRSFLIALDIEYGLLKDPEEKSKFDNSKEKSESRSRGVFTRNMLTFKKTFLIHLILRDSTLL